MNDKQLRWFTVALIAFNMVWGMGNVVNNYAQQGISVVTSWLIRPRINDWRIMLLGLIGSSIFLIWHKNHKQS